QNLYPVLHADRSLQNAFDAEMPGGYGRRDIRLRPQDQQRARLDLALELAVDLDRPVVDKLAGDRRAGLKHGARLVQVGGVFAVVLHRLRPMLYLKRRWNTKYFIAPQFILLVLYVIPAKAGIQDFRTGPPIKTFGGDGFRNVLLRRRLPRLRLRRRTMLAL